MKQYKFKEVTLKDLANILPEAEHAFLPSKEDPEETTSQLLYMQAKNEGFHAFAVYMNNDICSFIIIWPYKEQNSIAIGPMFVSKQYRGQGLGVYQLEELLNWAKQHGIQGIFTKTWESNKASRSTFEHCNFECIGEKIGERVNGENTVKYYLTL